MTTQTTDGLSRAARRAASQGAPPPGPAGPVASAGPTGDRLPVPTRRRRPALAALAVVLILGGAALSGYLVLSSGQKQSVLVLARDVPYGHEFAAGDFREAQLSYSSDLEPILTSQLTDLVGNRYRAKQAIAAGTPLTRGMITSQVEVPSGDYVQAGVVAPDGQYPVEGVSPGDTVKVLYTPRSTGGDTSALVKGASISPGATVIRKAYVKDVQRIEGGDDTGVWMTLLVDNSELTPGRVEGLAILQAANAVRALSVEKFPESTTSQTGGGER
jgi:SAF domain